MAGSDPVHSKTTSNPSEAEKWVRAAAAFSLACLSCSSGKTWGCCDGGVCDGGGGIEQQGSAEDGIGEEEGGLGRQKVSSAKPFSLAKSRRA